MGPKAKLEAVMEAVRVEANLAGAGFIDSLLNRIADRKRNGPGYGYWLSDYAMGCANARRLFIRDLGRKVPELRGELARCIWEGRASARVYRRNSEMRNATKGLTATVPTP